MLLPCPFTWKNELPRNHIPTTFLGHCRWWQGFECNTWVQAISIEGVPCTKWWTMVGAVQSTHPLVETVNSMVRGRGEEPRLVNVWVEIAVHGVFCMVFLSNATSSPSLLPTSLPTSTSYSTTSALPVTPGLC